MTYKEKTPTMPKQSTQPESLRKALEMARNEKERIQAVRSAGALAAATKKAKPHIKKHK
jgi:hypothetical protein